VALKTIDMRLVRVKLIILCGDLVCRIVTAIAWAYWYTSVWYPVAKNDHRG